MKNIALTYFYLFLRLSHIYQILVSPVRDEGWNLCSVEVMVHKGSASVSWNILGFVFCFLYKGSNPSFCFKIEIYAATFQALYSPPLRLWA